MKTYIALLRGINVGGHHRLPMKSLRDLLAGLGLENVQTYIASGNVVFEGLLSARAGWNRPFQAGRKGGETPGRAYDCPELANSG